MEMDKSSTVQRKFLVCVLLPLSAAGGVGASCSDGRPDVLRRPTMFGAKRLGSRFWAHAQQMCSCCEEPVFWYLFATMSTESDACVPKALTDFVFDLYDSVITSQLPEEQTNFYNDFRDLSSKYFSNQPWPSPQAIASECNGHPLFLAIYRELTHRHWHAVSRPNIRDRVEGFQVYRELFEE
jgi:hypothetical protein